MKKRLSAVKKKNLLFKRMEVSIVVIIALTSIATAVLAFIIFYASDTGSQVGALADTSTGAAEFIQANVDPRAFTDLSTVESMQTDLYNTTKEELDGVRNMIGAKYVYLVSQTGDGRYIYTVEGQPEGETGVAPGVTMEAILASRAVPAFEGKDVFPGNVIRTSMGPSYVSFLPVKDGTGQILGVIGIEYDSSEILNGSMPLLFYSILVCIGLTAAIGFVSVTRFKKIFDPFYQQLTYTDMLTDLNNRTAFELELKRMQLSIGDYVSITLIILDLNNLKDVNDRLGQHHGDDYIRQVALALERHFRKFGECYRLGGDELGIIAVNTDPARLQQILETDFIQELYSKQAGKSASKRIAINLSYGLASFDPEVNHNLHEVYALAERRLMAMKNEAPV